MISALALGSLHGEAIHPVSEQPNAAHDQHEAAVLGQFLEGSQIGCAERDAFQLLVEMAEFRYVSPLPEGDSVVLHTDMRNLPRVIDARASDSIRCAVTSPPYLNVTSFEEDQWLRLWFLGGPTSPKKGAMSRDDRHGTADNYWSFIGDMWRSLGAVMAEVPMS